MNRRRVTLAGGALLGLALSVLASTGREPPPGRAVSEPCGPETAPTLAATVLHESPALAIPTRLELVGDHLVVIDAAADSVLHVLNRHTGALVRSFGRRGRGPGEFWGAWALDAAREGEPAVWVYDLSLRRLTLVPLTPEVARMPSLSTMVELDDGRLVTEPRWTDAQTIVAAGLLSDARVVLYDAEGHHIGALGDPPFLPTSRQPIQAGQARMALHPNGTMAVLASRYASTLDLVSLVPGTVSSAAGPVAVNADGRPIGLDWFAYVDVTATAQAIVALFSGREERAYGSRAPFGRCLHVFEWRGRFEAALGLDTDVLSIAADPEGRFIYALRHHPVPAVIRFALPLAESSGPIARHGASTTAR